MSHTERSCWFLALGLTLWVRPAPAQVSGVDYTLSIDSTDLSGITVDVRVHGAPAEFRVAMVWHTEYDDQYWKYLTELRGESSRGAVQVARGDSSLWRVSGPAGTTTLHYRLRFPESRPMEQAAWMAHLTPTGGLVGGPHSFLYVVGAEHAPVRVTVVLPPSWSIVTGLRAGSGRGSFTASGVEALTDSPMLVGLIRLWPFEVDGVPHRIAWLGRAAGVAFDTALFVGSVERLAREAVHLFGHTTYRDYQFLFEDGSYGGLEHGNSVTIGVQSSDLARDPSAYLEQTAHEFVHTWNEVYLRPVSWIGVRHVAPAPTGELWWSEGVTLFFADLVLRRAGLPTSDSTRVLHLERLLRNYTANPSHGVVSPEQTSRAFNLPLDVTGDYTPSMFSQGELLGTVLDLMIREGSGDRRTLGDAMAALLAKFSPERGFLDADVERAVSDACACDARPFFDRYVRATGALDFDRWLGVLGLRSTVSWAPARSADSLPAPDLRLSAYAVPGDSALRLKLWFPGTRWGRAGFHTGDRLDSLNSVAMRDPEQFRPALSQLHVGDTVRLVAWRGLVNLTRTVTIAGFDRPTVRLVPRSDATDAERRRLAQWMAAR